MADRIRGECGDRMVEAALAALYDGPFPHGAQVNMGKGTGTWRAHMRAGLEAAFEELLKEPGCADQRGAEEADAHG